MQDGARAEALGSLWFEVTRPVPETCRIAVFGVVDIATVHAFESAIRATTTNGATGLELDLRHVSFMGACGIPAVQAAAEHFGKGAV